MSIVSPFEGFDIEDFETYRIISTLGVVEQATNCVYFFNDI
jgi:hypothetical protein